MKRPIILFFLIAPTILLVLAVFVRSKSDSTRVDFGVEYTNTVTKWNQKTYVPLKPGDEIASRLQAMKLEDGDILTIAQRATLINSVIGWFKAYSAGSKESYVSFRFPPRVPWTWKVGSLEKMSNYFVNGIVFDTDFLREAWMRRYGHPDNITNMLPYADSAKEWTGQERRDIRVNWIKNYGDGTASKTVYHPNEPFEQWQTIANEHAGTNWWSNYWTGVCVDEMIIRISKYTEVPEPLHKYPFGPIHHRSGYDVTAPFPNMGIARMDRKSYIDWNFNYQDLLQKQGYFITANILCMFTRSKPEFPQPALLRLVYVNEFEQWVPMEMVNAHVMNGERCTMFF